ncbi:mucin-5AC-like [Notolabrus celidotus]|uniref:mucin-5AC-like n=1 Tax=Notolabrus celidotus TaxID=1203425 RepID=UPI001490764E|nr:mucin-5AC-like [Notolabrus celidotus]
MAPGVRSGRRTGHPKVSAAAAVVVVVVAGGEDAGGRSDAGGEGRCLRSRWRAGAAGMLGNCVLSVGMLLLVVRCAVAAEEKPTYDASGSSSLPSDHVVTAASAHPLADLSVAEEVPFSVVHPDGDSDTEVEGLSGQPAFSSVLTVMAGTVKHPVSLDQSRTSPTITRDETHTTQWPLHSSSQGSEMSSFSSSSVGERILPASSEAGTDDLTAGTSRAVALTFPKEKVASLAPSQSVRITLSAGPTERTSQVSPLPPQQDPRTASVEVTTTTVASTTKTKDPISTMPSLGVTTQSTTTTTPQPTPMTRRVTTTTIRTQTSRRIFTPPVPRTGPPKAATTIFISPFTTTTEAPPQQCNNTERLWVKTVVSIYVRRNRLDSIQRQNLRRGLSQGLRKALNDSSAQAQKDKETP